MESIHFCDHCGAEIKPGQGAFCSFCGQRINSVPFQGSTSSNASTINVPSSFSTLRLIHQRYSIVGQLGKGGMGAVYKAMDNSLGGRLVAVKEMNQFGLSGQDLQEAIEAFKKECLMLARLRHPSIPIIYDHFSENNRWYLIMDFIEGDTLEKIITKRRQLPFKEVLNLGLQICSVLEYLHTRIPPVIFRDLKPANIMLTANDQLYLIDFGIARVFRYGQAKDTTALGSPGYAAPEQYGRAQTTVRSDIYSLGAILHQLLTGDDPSLSPFNFAPIEHYHVSSVFNDFIMRMLNIKTEQRPANITIVKDMLQQQLAASNKPQNYNVIPTVSPLPSTTLSVQSSTDKITLAKEIYVDVNKSYSHVSLPSTANSDTFVSVNLGAASGGIQKSNQSPSILRTPSGSFSGKKKQVTGQFFLKSGLAIFLLNHQGNGNFIVHLHNEQGKVVYTLANDIGKMNGSQALEVQHGIYSFEVEEVSGLWSVGYSQENWPVEANKKSFEGRGRTATAMFSLPTSTVEFQITHQGKDHFVVHLLEDNGAKVNMLANKIGVFSGTKTLLLPSGMYLLNIKADGAWRISFT